MQNCVTPSKTKNPQCNEECKRLIVKNIINVRDIYHPCVRGIIYKGNAVPLEEGALLRLPAAALLRSILPGLTGFSCTPGGMYLGQFSSPVRFIYNPIDIEPDPVFEFPGWE